MSNPVSTSIVAVSVFADRARVTRRGRCSVASGIIRVEVAELPLSIETNSVRVAARGTALVTLLGVDIKQVFFKETPTEKIRAVESRLRQLQDEDAADADRLTNWSKQVEHVDGVGGSARVFARGIARGQFNLEQHADLIKFLDVGRSALQQQIRALSVQRRERQREIEKVQNELQQLQSQRPTARHSAFVDLRASVECEVEVDVVYFISGAHWKPLYDIRFRDEAVQITYLAEVAQQTGEDWKGVSLTLSTARPTNATRIPRLLPWEINKRIPVGHWQAPPAEMLATMVAAPMAKARSASVSIGTARDAIAPQSFDDADVEVAKVESNGAAVTFAIPGSVDVPSDRTPHKSTIGVFELKPQLDYVVVPKMADAVFRRAKVANASQFTLLAGRAQLFIDDDYFGASDLPLATPTEKFDLFLGVDDRIKVERRRTKRDVAKSMLGGRKRIHYGYQIKLDNHTGKPQKITVVDHIPHSQHEDIKVTLDSVDPKPDRQDDLNTIVWKLTLEPNVERKIVYEFTVDQPREMDVSGL